MNTQDQTFESPIKETTSSNWPPLNVDNSKFVVYKDDGDVVYFARDWMRNLSDSLHLTEITYPASHDTAAGPEDFFDIAHRVQTQEWVITD
jgi:hypothetical protein